jgi:hypothetical protein
VPWRISKGGACPPSRPWGVIQISNGRLMGCHPSRARAIRQQRALYAREASLESDILTEVKPHAKEAAARAAELMTKLAEAGIELPVRDEAGVTIEIDKDETDVSMSWEGILSLEGAGTSDGRWFEAGAWSWRDLPLTLMAQTVTEEGHKGAEVAGRIDDVWKLTVDEAREAGYEIDGEVPDDAVLVMGTGAFDSGDFGRETARLVTERTLRGVSVDYAVLKAGLRDPDTGKIVDESDMELEDILFGNYQRAALQAEIMAATIVATPAFASAGIAMVASGDQQSISTQIWLTSDALVASAGVAPLRPPAAWFDDPRLSDPTPLTITDDGRIYGHLALWDSCHTGFTNVCKAPPRSASNFAYFNTGEMETAEGELVSCGKLMFCREGKKHAPLEYSAMQASRHYDDSTKVGGFVRAGADAFGIYLTGATRSDLTDEEVQYLRQNPPSGDWRPINRGPSELIAAFSVPVGGFPIPRSELRLVASAEHGEDDEIAALILSAPDFADEIAYGDKKISRKSRRKLKALVASARG